MADALRARHHGIEKLLCLQTTVSINVFKPFGRVARCVLYLQHFNRTQGFIGLQCLGHISGFGKTPRQLDGVFQCKLGAAAD